MEHLYTPWRMAYIRGEKKPAGGCVFCDAPKGDDAVSMIVGRSQHVYVIMNIYPYNSGHVMVVPYAHVSSQEQLSEPALLDMMVTANRMLGILRSLYNPAAFNTGANIGQAAGAGIAEHYHLHLVPRWNGDANFISVVGETRVIPDTLENTWRELHERWNNPD